MKKILNKNARKAFLNLLTIFDPGIYFLKLGKHTTELALASSREASSSAFIPTIKELRVSVAESLKSKELRYPKNMKPESYNKEVIGGMDCYIFRAQSLSPVPTLIMFCGGGFCLDTMAAHKAFMANVAAEMPCNIILPDYPLAPETKASEIIKRTTTFLKEFLNNPVAFNFSNNIILMGWSSGSNVVLTLSMNLLNEAPHLFNKVSRLILLSPWVDLSMRVAREGPYQAQQKMDTIAAGPDLLEMMAKCYLPDGFKGNEPEFCPAFRKPEEMSKLPPTTVIVGGCEVLLGDGVSITDKLKNAGAPVQFIALEGQTHNYMVFHKLSLDGVFVPALIARIVTEKLIDRMVGKDGLGLIVKKFNTA